MNEEKLRKPDPEENPLAQEPAVKKQWQQPKLTFVKPKLTKHGELKQITAGFFQVFTP